MDEVELHRSQMVLVRGMTGSKMGSLVLTTERLLFFDERYSHAGAGGILDELLLSALQRRIDRGGPVLDLPLGSITRIARETKLLAKDRIRISTADDDVLLNEGWKALSPLLLETLGSRHGKRTVEEAPDSWRVEPA